MSKIVVFFEHLHCVIKLDLYRHKGPSIYDVTLQGGVKRSVTVCDRGGGQRGVTSHN